MFSKILNTISFCVGCFIILFMFYRLFFINIDSYLIIHSSPIKIVCTYYIFIISIFIFCIMCKHYFFGPSTGIVYKYVHKIITFFIYNPLTTFSMFCLRSTRIKQFSMFLCRFLTTLIYNNTVAYIFTYYFFIIPRLFFCTYLFLDVFILHQVNLLLKFVVLFSCPIITLSILSFLKLFAEQEKINLETYYVDVTFDSITKRYILIYKNENTTYQHCVFWDVCVYSLDRILYIEDIRKTKNMLLIQLLILSFLIYCWYHYLLIIVSIT